MDVNVDNDCERLNFSSDSPKLGILENSITTINQKIPVIGYILFLCFRGFIKYSSAFFDYKVL